MGLYFKPIIIVLSSKFYLLPIYYTLFQVFSCYLTLTPATYTSITACDLRDRLHQTDCKSDIADIFFISLQTICIQPDVIITIKVPHSCHIWQDYCTDEDNHFNIIFSNLLYYHRKLFIGFSNIISLFLQVWFKIVILSFLKFSTRLFDQGMFYSFLDINKWLQYW